MSEYIMLLSLAGLCAIVIFSMIAIALTAWIARLIFPENKIDE